MRRQDKIDMHDPKDPGVHANKPKPPFPQPAKTTDMGKAAADKKDAASKEFKPRHKR